ncbi:hypothetical protein CIK04_29625 [Vibrio sp. 03_296]|uniref:hypothetical protein n=1 Tax=Vibrio sp. 03_296 TaxID=2024409 RepID=UPI000BDAEA94|nr:hypothetical protein [Vibrio sp. 03_296]OZT82130.1 hypothetical protein CIK04_29625 [Vibrio sp. 03_296]
MDDVMGSLMKLEHPQIKLNTKIDINMKILIFKILKFTCPNFAFSIEMVLLIYNPAIAATKS